MFERENDGTILTVKK